VLKEETKEAVVPMKNARGWPNHEKQASQGVIRTIKGKPIQEIKVLTTEKNERNTLGKVKNKASGLIISPV